MRPGTVRDRAEKIIGEELGAEVSKLTDSTDLFDELGADSLDRVELVIELESEFSIDIDDEEGLALRTVGDVVALCERKAER